MSDNIVNKGSYSRYPLIDNRVQAEVMSYVRSSETAVSRARLIRGS